MQSLTVEDSQDRPHAVHGVRTPLAAALSGASFRQLDYWATQCALVPSIADAQGSGSHRRYTMHDVYVAAVLARLSRCGAKTATHRRVVDFLRDRPIDEWRGLVLYVDDVDGVCSVSVAPRLSSGWFVDLEAVWADVSDRCDEHLS